MAASSGSLSQLQALMAHPVPGGAAAALIRSGLGGLASTWHARDGCSLALTCLHTMLQGPMQVQHRCYAKAAGKGGDKKAAAPAPVEKPKADPKLATPLSRLHWVYKTGKDKGPTSLLTSEQKEAVEQLTGTGASEHNPEGLVSFKQMGVPLSPRDVVQLMHDSFSRTMGENVHLRPFVYSNIFQSAPAVAQYVAAALETGVAWPRIERFFLACLGEDKTVAAIKVQVSGRIGRKTDMARKQVWAQGSLKLGHLQLPIDFGLAQALTRQGVLGVKVWLRYKPGLASQAMHLKESPKPDIPLPALLSMPRAPLPSSPSAWWHTPGPAQPAAHRTWQAFEPDFSPTTEDVSRYVAAQQPVLFTSNRQRIRYLSKVVKAIAPADEGAKDNLQQLR